MNRKAVVAILLCFMILFALSGCAGKSAESPASAASYSYASEESAMDVADADYGVASSTTQDAGAGESVDASETLNDADVRKIVYNAELALTTDDPQAALDTLTAKTAALGGYVSNSYVTMDDDGASRSTATFKVPAASLDELVGAAKDTGAVNNYRLYSDDISLSYYDIQARLKNAQAEEKQLLEILSRCESIEDILAVRQSISSVRADIESYTAQINLWDNLVSYATLELTIYRTQKAAVAQEKELLQLWKASDVWNKMSRGFINSARFMVNAVGAIGIFLAIAIVPAGIVFLVVVLPILIRRKKRRLQKLADNSAPAEPEAEAPDTERMNE